jgi:hypothetical protein
LLLLLRLVRLVLRLLLLRLLLLLLLLVVVLVGVLVLVLVLRGGRARAALLLERTVPGALPGGFGCSHGHRGSCCRRRVVVRWVLRAGLHVLVRASSPRASGVLQVLAFNSLVGG